MSCVPMEFNTSEFGPLDYLTQLVRLMSTLRGGESRYSHLIIAKIQESPPHIASSILQILDLGEPSSSSSSGSSPASTRPFMHYYPLS